MEAAEAAGTAQAAVPGTRIGADDRRTLRLLALLIGFLIAKRVVYHLAYLALDPFALVTLSDGQIYEEAARDILLHPPLGTQPFYLQGLYAYVLALPMLLVDRVVLGLLF